jgi:hypothetical protein
MPVEHVLAHLDPQAPTLQHGHATAQRVGRHRTRRRHHGDPVARLEAGRNEWVIHCASRTE